jgi:hypothetical protein
MMLIEKIYHTKDVLNDKREIYIIANKIEKLFLARTLTLIKKR